MISLRLHLHFHNPSRSLKLANSFIYRNSPLSSNNRVLRDLRFTRSTSSSSNSNPPLPPNRNDQRTTERGTTTTLRENIYTIPNALTCSRILASPFLGWFILDGNFTAATGLLVYCGLTDWVRIPPYFICMYATSNCHEINKRLMDILLDDIICKASWARFSIPQQTRHS